MLEMMQCELIEKCFSLILNSACSVFAYCQSSVPVGLLILLKTSYLSPVYLTKHVFRMVALPIG